MSRRRNPPSRIDERVAGEIDACLSLRATGMTHRAIVLALDARGMTLSQTTVCRRLEQGFSLIVLPSVEQARAREVDAHGRLLENIAGRVRAGDTKAIACWLRTHEAIAKLLGLYAPLQVQVEHAATTSVDEELAALAELLGINDRVMSPSRDAPSGPMGEDEP